MCKRTQQLSLLSCHVVYALRRKCVFLVDKEVTAEATW
jgi:hypothetical protein